MSLLNHLKIRKRKNHFNLSRSQQKKNLKLIKQEALKNLTSLCKSMGLRINEIKIAPDVKPTEEVVPKINVARENFDNDYKAFI